MFECVYCGYTVHVCSTTETSIVCMYVCVGFRVDLHVVRGGLAALMLDERRIPSSLCVIM